MYAGIHVFLWVVSIVFAFLTLGYMEGGVSSVFEEQTFEDDWHVALASSIASCVTVVLILVNFILMDIFFPKSDMVKQAIDVASCLAAFVASILSCITFSDVLHAKRSIEEEPSEALKDITDGLKDLVNGRRLATNSPPTMSEHLEAFAYVSMLTTLGATLLLAISLVMYYYTKK